MCLQLSMYSQLFVFTLQMLGLASVPPSPSIQVPNHAEPRIACFEEDRRKCCGDEATREAEVTK